jgi:hypothetical protein
MDKTKFKDLISLVFNSVKGMVEDTNRSSWIRPESYDYFYTILPEKGVDRISEKCTRFDFTISHGVNGEKMKYSFHVTISKVKRTKGFWKAVDDSRYITKIGIKEYSSYSSSEIEAYYLDTDYMEKGQLSTRDIQSKMFDFLMETHIKKESEKENQKINGFISEIKKAADKAVVRDEKIDNILN